LISYIYWSFPFLKTDINRYHEKLVILITDGPPCNLLNDKCPCDSKDLWKISGEFEKQDIILVVIGIEPSVTVCDDFYCALANKTGVKNFSFLSF
jgi:Mg-chelatase subunit ChlD